MNYQPPTQMADALRAAGIKTKAPSKAALPGWQVDRVVKKRRG